MDEFTKLLLSSERNIIIPEEDDFFGKLIGKWDFDMLANPNTEQEHHVNGEWVFSRVLEGMAIQDIFICPARDQRTNGGEYGTTIRYYNKNNRTWDIAYSCAGGTARLEAKKEGNKVVLTEITEKRIKWTFSDITENTFRWTSTELSENGDTTVYCIIFAVRRK